MNRILFVILSGTLVACSGSQTTRDQAGGKAVETSSEAMKDAGYKRYQVESAMIEYEMSGPQKGTEMLYFDKWGMREAKVTNTAMAFVGFTKKTNQLVILDGEWSYSIDLDKKTGTKTKHPLMQEIAEKQGKDFAKVGEQMMSRMGERVGSEEVAGKMCEVWEVKDLGSKSWVWKGIPLKTHVNMVGMRQTVTATKVEADASIPDDKFAIPSGVTITEGPDVKELLKQMKKGKPTQ